MAPFHRTVKRVNAVERTGTVAPQPTETRLGHSASIAPLPTRTAYELRHTYVNLGVIVWPLISGLFFGLVATVLLLGNGGAVHALKVGAVAGAVICAVNALALCVFMTTMSDDRSIPQAQPEALDARGVSAS